jgi:universal stress protein A
VLFKRILCPVDFSDCSMIALKYAISLAQEADAHLTVVHVMTYETELTPEMRDSLTAYGHVPLADFRRAYEKDCRQQLEAAIPDSVREYRTVETMLTGGTPYREILRVAAEQQADLIVIGVQGRGAADLMLFGSTTQHVVRHATCPVLTLRKGGAQGTAVASRAGRP